MSEQAEPVQPEITETELRESLKRPTDYRERLASWQRWGEGMKMLHAIKAEVAAKNPQAFNS